jgi:hypothetical protein
MAALSGFLGAAHAASPDRLLAQALPAGNLLCAAKTTYLAARFLRTQGTFPKWNRGPSPLHFASRGNRGQEPLKSSFALPIE